MPTTPTKRSFHTMIEQPPMTMDGIVYQDLSHGYYSTPPPPQTLLFSHPFTSPEGGYVSEGYVPATESMGFYPSHRSLSEPFIHQPGDSSCRVSSGSSCNTSLAATPPPPPSIKFPAVPISPSYIIPRQKAKRTATACEECRKRKQKCDGVSPCQSCKEQKLECKYREVTPTKKDTSMERLVQLVENCSKSMEALNQRLDTMSSTLRVIERRLSRCWQCGASVEFDTGACNSCNHAPCRL